MRCLKLSPWTFLFVFKNIFWLCLFPTILWTHKWAPQIQKFGQKWQISPKSSKIQKYWWFFKFHRQIFRIPPKVPWVWFLRSYVPYWQNYDFLKKSIFWNFCNFLFKNWFNKARVNIHFCNYQKITKNNFFVILMFNVGSFCLKVIQWT